MSKSPFKSNEKKQFKLKDFEIEATINALLWPEDELDIWNTDINKIYDAPIEAKGSYGWPSDAEYHDHIRELAKMDSEYILLRWSGAIVRFFPHNLYAPIQVPLVVDTSGTQSRSTWPGDKWTSAGCGTVISVDESPNYKGQWHVTVLWADGLMSYEKITDLVVVCSPTIV